MEEFRRKELQRGRCVASSRIVTFALGMFVLTACGSSNQDAAARSGQAASTPAQLHAHANGLQLSVDKTFAVESTSSGFVIAPVNDQHVRNPIHISIELLAKPPESTGIRVRLVGSGRLLWYSVTRSDEGGSSGWEWTVVAFEHVGDEWIRYRESKLAEYQPDELWDIARGLRYRPSEQLKH